MPGTWNSFFAHGVNDLAGLDAKAADLHLIASGEHLVADRVAVQSDHRVMDETPLCQPLDVFARVTCETHLLTSGPQSAHAGETYTAPTRNANVKKPGMSAGLIA
jgi:hypothetical protein